VVVGTDLPWSAENSVSWPALILRFDLRLEFALIQHFEHRVATFGAGRSITAVVQGRRRSPAPRHTAVCFIHRPAEPNLYRFLRSTASHLDSLAQDELGTLSSLALSGLDTLNGPTLDMLGILNSIAPFKLGTLNSVALGT
jgi:hypothetical protein